MKKRNILLIISAGLIIIVRSLVIISGRISQFPSKEEIGTPQENNGL